MELRQFIVETLKQVFEGVSEVMREPLEFDKEHLAFRINPRTRVHETHGVPWDDNGQPTQSVEFDVAVTTTESAESEVGAKISVAGFGVGGQKQSELSNSVVSRVKFSVPVSFPQFEHMRSLRHKKKDAEDRS